MKQFIIIATLLISSCNTIPEQQIIQTPPKPVERPPTCCANPPSRKCDDFHTEVTQTLQAKNLDDLTQWLVRLKKQSDCSADYLYQLKRNISDIAAAKATDLVQRGQLEEADKWLQHQYTPIKSWTTQRVRGDIAAKRQQWKPAAKFYNQALDLLNDAAEKPSPAEIEKIQKLAIETQLLDGTLIASFSDSKTNPIPVTFAPAKTQLTNNGKKLAKQLAHYLWQKNVNQITLIGHTDGTGSDAYNCELSKNRALALKKYLLEKGVHAKITTLGKGKREPFQLSDPTRYTQTEIDQINRRVEFVIDREISYDNICL